MDWPGSVVAGPTGPFTSLTHHSFSLLNKFQFAFQFTYRKRQREQQTHARKTYTWIYMYICQKTGKKGTGEVYHDVDADSLQLEK